MRIDVHFDVICPWCFVGFQRLQKALKTSPSFQANLYWHPYFLNQDPEDYALDYFSYMEKKIGGSLRVERLMFTFREIGEGLGIPFDFESIRSIPNTLNAHKLIQLAGTLHRQTDMLYALFTAYFCRGLDIGDPEILKEIAADFDLGDEEVQALFDDESLGEYIITSVQNMKRTGANGIPFFVFENAFQITGAHEPEIFVRMMQVANTFVQNIDDFSALQTSVMVSPHQTPVR